MNSILKISELTKRIRGTLEKVIGAVWVEGEISNLTYHASGHVYLTLKDADSQISAVMFRGDASRLQFRLKDGMLVQVHGRVTVYEKRGQYQMVLDAAQLAGHGSLQAAFEALKRKLEAEGLFEAARKRALPSFPQTVGVVTARGGAALQDFCRVLHRRYPGIRIVVVSVHVQGEGAAREIAEAVDLLNSKELIGTEVEPDVIALIRGGGSLEDLWAFNEEIVARAVARSRIPTISGVGHEVDFTICDFVADVRAATPSVAAELVIRSRAEFVSEVLDLSEALERNTQLNIEKCRRRLMEGLEALRQREPRRFLQEWRQRLDDASSGLQREVQSGLRTARDRHQAWSRRFDMANPRIWLATQQARLEVFKNRQDRVRQDFFSRLQHRLELAGRRLELLSPKSILSRGYSITQDSTTGKVIRSVKEVESGGKIKTRFIDGEVESVISMDN